MGTLQSWRKAYGALKDTTKVGIANLSSDFKDVDIAIVKATNHVECPPKERHLRKILAATSVTRPRADVAYCIHALSRRLAKTHNWTVALKTLIVIHRTLREGDPTFREELLSFSQRGRILQLSNFKDDSSPTAWDCSAWVRTYALFLEERLECFRVLKYDVEAERLNRPTEGPEKGRSRTRDLNSEELLEQLPALQQLLYRLIGCRPEGAAVGNYIVQYALALVLKESFKIYCAINDGIINLVDKFFEMPRHEAFKALEIYKRAGQQAGSLSDFYETCRGLELARNFQFPVLREPPQTFLATMEEYIKDAPRMVSVPSAPLEFQERLLLTYKPEEASPLPEDQKPAEEEPTPPPIPQEEVAAPPPNIDTTGDLLGLDAVHPDASAIEDSNALALAIVPSGAPAANGSGTMQANAFDPTGWELALVTTPSNNAPVERQLHATINGFVVDLLTSTFPTSHDFHITAGGLDSLTLDSLYDEAAYRQTQAAAYGAAPPNPFAMQDPFAPSNTVAAPPSVQMAAIAQQQQMSMMMQSNPFLQANNPQLQQNFMPVGASNPFGDTAFGTFPVNHPNNLQNNPFGSTNLL